MKNKLIEHLGIRWTVVEDGYDYEIYLEGSDIDLYELLDDNISKTIIRKFKGYE